MCGLTSRLLYRALEILDTVDLSTASVRADLAGPRFIPQYLYSAAELIDRAADLVATSATVAHDNERRWRVFQKQAREVARSAESQQEDGHGEQAIKLAITSAGPQMEKDS